MEEAEVITAVRFVGTAGVEVGVGVGVGAVLDAVKRGDAASAERWSRRLATMDPLNGRYALRLMESLAALGDRAGALRHARVHQALIAEELGSQPDPAVVALAERLREAPEIARQSSTPDAPAAAAGDTVRVLPLDF